MLNIIDEKITSPVRTIKGKAELYSSSAAASYGKYVTFENVVPAEKVKVKVSPTTEGENIVGSTITVGGRNVLNLEAYSAYGSGYKDKISNNYGTTISTTDAVNSVTVTQTQYPDASIIGNFSNGYFCIYLKTIPSYDENYVFSCDIEIISNPLSVKKINFLFGAVGVYSSSFQIDTPFEVGKKYRAFGYSTFPNNGRQYIEVRVCGMSLVMSNIQLELGTTATEYEHFKEPTVYTIDETLTIEAEPYIPTTVIYPNNSGIFIEKAECKVCQCANTFSYNDDLQEINIERVGEESKFFGFGVCQKLNLKLLDTNRSKSFSTDNYIRAYFGTDEESYISNFPNFYVSETHRDENTNALSITAYDLIKTAEKHTVAELGLTSYTIKEFAAAAAAFFGLTLEIQGVEDFTLFNLEYAAGANFEGTESIREALTAVAEATQTIYYVTENKLVFKRLSILPAAAITIDKENYISLDSGENRRLQAICATNELGDATTASISAIGTTQFIRDNPFLELREDIADILDNAIAAVGGLSINQFTCSWRGNYLVEIGDKLGLITKDNETVYSYLLNDTISYNGAFSESTQWNYTDSNESANNPTTLGEALKQTFAKVDKANKQIDIVVSEAAANGSAIAALQINTESINASVKETQESTAEAIEGVNEKVNTFQQEVTATINADRARLEVIQEELENGVSKVKTSMGYEFSDSGLILDKTGAETNTKITENGITVNESSGGAVRLKADKDGVDAENLHATTYLIVGTNSRFENYGNDRTGCFWIGG